MKIDFKGKLYNRHQSIQKSGKLKAMTIILLLSYMMMLIWNNLASGTYAMIEMSYWHALGILLIASFLSGRLFSSERTTSSYNIDAKRN